MLAPDAESLVKQAFKDWPADIDRKPYENRFLELLKWAARFERVECMGVVLAVKSRHSAAEGYGLSHRVLNEVGSEINKRNFEDAKREEEEWSW